MLSVTVAKRVWARASQSPQWFQTGSDGSVCRQETCPVSHLQLAEWSNLLASFVPTHLSHNYLRKSGEEWAVHASGRRTFPTSDGRGFTLQRMMSPTAVAG